jgi:hypothetical protein
MSEQHHSGPTPAAGAVLLAGFCLVCLTLVPSAIRAKDDSSRPQPVQLNPELGETLSAAEAARFGLFTEVEGLQEVVFLEAPWGGFLARLTVETATGTVWRERNISTRTWREWQQHTSDILAGRVPTRTLAPPAFSQDAAADAHAADGMAPSDSLSSHLQEPIRVWPEVPLPPTFERVVPVDSVLHDYQSLGGRWLVLLEAGVRHNITDFRAFFTDMGMIGLSWGHMVGRLMPYFSMEVGFGDLRDDFEELAGNGRSNTYGFSIGLMARQPTGSRVEIYGSGAFGYFIRSLQWQGIFIDSYRNTVSDGLVLEQQDWGWAFRAGFLIKKRHARKARFIDIGMGLQMTPAEEWHYFDETSNFHASDRDMWVTLSIRFGDSL